MKIVLKGSKDDMYDMMDKLPQETRTALEEAAAEDGVSVETTFEQVIADFITERRNRH